MIQILIAIGTICGSPSLANNSGYTAGQIRSCQKTLIHCIDENKSNTSREQKLWNCVKERN